MIFLFSVTINHRTRKTYKLEVLHNNNLKVSLTKSTFAVASIDFLRDNISVDDNKPTTKNVEDPPPNDDKSLRRFLGMFKLIES